MTRPVKRRPLNVLKGKITRIIPRSRGANLVVEFAPGVRLVSSLTAGSLGAMKPRPGQSASAVISSLDIVLAPHYPECKQTHTL